MEEFIHQQNLALFKKRLEEPHTAAAHEMLMKLLADEQAKGPPKIENLNSSQLRLFPKEKSAWRGRHQAGLSLVEAPGGTELR